MGMEPMRYDIGGVYELVLVKDTGGYHGHYKVMRTGMRFTFDGRGMSKKKILTKFWDRVKERQIA